MKKTLYSEQTISIAILLLTTLLTYGVLIPRLGFYRDDWYLIWMGQSRGVSGIIGLFRGDRPLVGYVYALEYLLLGARPLGWHLAALLVKAAAALAFFWLARSLWPQKRTETLFLALLFTVYPGFLQQPNAGVFNPLLLAHLAAILSFGLTIRAIKARRPAAIALHALALPLALLYLGIFESMIGLEAGRILLAGYAVWREEKTLRRVVRRLWPHLLPYLILAGAFLYWRLFVFESARPAVDVQRLLAEYAASPARSLLTLILASVKDVIETTLFAWFVPAYQLTVSAQAGDALAAALIVLLVLGLAYAYLRLAVRRGWASSPENPPDAPDAAVWMMALGAGIVVFGLLPITLAGRDVRFALQWDRYTLHVSMGVCLFAGGFVFRAMQGWPRWAVVFSLLALGVIAQYHSAAQYRDFWADERALWRQLTWRAPGIEEGALLIVQIPGHSALAEDYEIYAPADLIYHPEAGLALSGDVLNGITIPRILRGEIRGNVNRGVYIHKNFRRVLIAVVPTPRSCLHVLNSQQVELPGYVNTQALTAAAFSDIARILPDAPPAVPPEAIFGREGRRDWCYYYQKMDLARQTGDWARVVELGEAAQAEGLRPADVSEWMPLLEAYANTGALDQAARLALEIKQDEGTQTLLCLQLQQPRPRPPSYNYNFILQTLCGTK